MEKLKSFLVISFLMAGTFLQAQTNESHEDNKQIGLRWGFHHYARQDQVFSPMIYKSGSPVNAQVLYHWNKKNKESHLEVLFDSHKLRWHEPYTYLSWPDGEEKLIWETFFKKLSFRYGKLWNINSEGFKKQFGFIVDNQINAFDFAYGRLTNFGYYANFSLSPMSQWRWQINDRSDFSLNVFLPLVSWVVRSPYALNDDEYIWINRDHNDMKSFFGYLGDGHFRTINNFQKFNLNIDYTYSLSGKWDLMAGYNFEFIHSSKPRRVLAYQNNIQLGANFKF